LQSNGLTPELGVPPGYSQVVEVRGGRIIFIAGQTARDRNGDIVGKGNFARQAAQVFENLNVALQSVGCTAANLIKLTAFSATWMTCPRTAKPGIDFLLR
jgi:enamine deaminase RidA (YjgF/YER057c/UK114 family)